MKTQDAPKGERPISGTNSNSDLGTLFDAYIAREFASPARFYSKMRRLPSPFSHQATSNWFACYTAT